MCVYKPKRPYTKSPFWDDKSETGIARRKKVLQRVTDRIARTATPPPPLKDIPSLDPDNESGSTS